jgi:hypothetical protein
MLAVRRQRTLALALLLASGLATALVSYYALTPRRTSALMGRDPDLVLIFAIGPDNPQLTCAQMDATTAATDPANADAAMAAAIAVGWLQRRCENDHIQLRLTAEGRRRSLHWGRSGDSPLRAREPEDEREVTDWFVTAARFERIGSPTIEPTAWDRRRVVVNGRWVPNEEGRLLQRAGWKEISSAAAREEDFEYQWWRWVWIPRLLGRD